MQYILAPIALFWINLQISIPLQIFMCSLVTLLCCLLLLIWQRAVHLSFFDSISLKQIEIAHPHVPSLRAIVTIFFCSISLFITSIHTIGFISLFNGPYETLYLAGLFAISAAVGILAETKWEGASEYSAAFLIGTTLAFLCLVFIGFAWESWVVFLILLALLAASMFLAWRVFYFSWGRRAKVFSILIFALWFLLYVVGQ